MLKEFQYSKDEEGIVSRLFYFVAEFSQKGVIRPFRFGDWVDIEEVVSPQDTLNGREFNSLKKIYNYVKDSNYYEDFVDFDSFYRLRTGLGENNNISMLSLSGLDLKAIPVNFLLEFNSLDTLFLSNNNLTFLPKILNGLSSLKHLYCNDNNFKNLNEVLFELPSLEEVNFENNPLNDHSLSLLDKLELEKGIYVYY